MSARRERRDKWLSRGVQVGFLFALLLFWYLGTTYWGVSHLLLPNPVKVWDELKDVLGSGEFWPDLKVTLSELAIAFAISATTGITLGYLISRSQYMIRVFEPLLAGMYSVPIILFLPLYVLLFGLGPGSKIAIGTTISRIVISMPLYFCGGLPSEPGENAHSGALYSSSMGRPPPTLTGRSALPIWVGIRYGTWMCRWYWLGGSCSSTAPGRAGRSR